MLFIPSFNIRYKWSRPSLIYHYKKLLRTRGFCCQGTCPLCRTHFRPDWWVLCDCSGFNGAKEWCSICRHFTFVCIMYTSVCFENFTTHFFSQFICFYFCCGEKLLTVDKRIVSKIPCIFLYNRTRRETSIYYLFHLPE